MNFVLCISGKIGSGKTTVANYISDTYNFDKVSFGDYVRNYAQLKGLPDNRHTLQELGQSLIEKDVIQFCKDVLASIQWDFKSCLVIDGIRHVEVFQIIKKLVEPLPAYLLYIETSTFNRIKRQITNTLKEIDNHPTEEDVKERLARMADIIIQTSDSIEEMKKEINKLILEKGKSIN